MAGAQSLSATDLDKVATRMQDVGEVPVSRLIATPITGGRSNLTFRLDDGTSSWVLRMPPRLGRTPSAHDIAREFTVTSALASTDVPVPPPVLLCRDDSVLGLPFAISRFVRGDCVQSRADLDALDAPMRSAVIHELMETLAALHAIDHRAVGLENLGAPTGYAQRQIRRWTQQWAIVGDPELRPLATELSERLSSVEFDQPTTAIVHGDYRIDNTLLSLRQHSADATVEAVVDWELSTIGDPTADVALMCVYRHPALDLVLGSPSAWASPNLPDADSLAAGYEHISGVTLRHWDAHMALGYFKLAVIAAGIDHRFRAGAAPDDGHESAAHAVPELLRCGLNHLRTVAR